MKTYKEDQDTELKVELTKDINVNIKYQKREHSVFPSWMSTQYLAYRHLFEDTYSNEWVSLFYNNY